MIVGKTCTVAKRDDPVVIHGQKIKHGCEKLGIIGTRNKIVFAGTGRTKEREKQILLPGKPFKHPQRQGFGSFLRVCHPPAQISGAPKRFINCFGLIPNFILSGQRPYRAMLGKILIVDPVVTNRIAMRVKLSAAHYDVRQAETVAQSTTCAAAYLPDLILTSAHLQDGDAGALAHALHDVQLGGKIPVMALATIDDPDERLRMLSAGVDEVAIKPVADAFLFARIRSLIRAYASSTEWELRDDTTRALGFAEKQATFQTHGRVAVISTSPGEAPNWVKGIRGLTPATIVSAAPAQAFSDRETAQTPDAFVLMADGKNRVAMQSLLATIRSQSASRHAAILVVDTGCSPIWGAQMLDMGANDLMLNGYHAPELAMRLDALLERKRQGDRLRATVRTGLQAAVSDPLTGLHNRRYAIPHLNRMIERAIASGKPLAVMVADLDHFKSINDTHGHAAGDAVLIQTAQRLRENVRGVDTVARIGGEEFLLILPGVSLNNARIAAVRLCSIIGDKAFDVDINRNQIKVTVSIGMTICNPARWDKNDPVPTAQDLIDRADKALYDAKSQGRNRVRLARPAA